MCCIQFDLQIYNFLFLRLNFLSAANLPTVLLNPYTHIEPGMEMSLNKY